MRSQVSHQSAETTNWLGLHGSGRHSDSDSVILDNFKMKQRFFHAGKVKLPVLSTDPDNEKLKACV